MKATGSVWNKALFIVTNRNGTILSSSDAASTTVRYCYGHTHCATC